ncbi:putative protein kinase YGL059W [Malassezia obtusa]|uniref:Anaphase spindle elongation protein 1 n=1 Tax=Malassezia obtusa TaxID=76774 RepID=A0AAF0DYI7_9BASI|nr:putative protein kinase YGL059W [Malassezia obtusa]
MDASTLSALIDASSAELVSLHEQLGSAPAELEKAIAALKTCIHDAVHAQLQLVQADVTRVAEQCAEHERVIAQLVAATGAERSAMTEQSAPLLAQATQLQDEQARLERAYHGQREQCDLVVEQVQTLDVCMSGAGGALPVPGPAHGAYQDVTPARLQQLEQHWQHVQQLYTTRKLQMETQLTEILQLWAELHILPKVSLDGLALQAAPGDEGEFHAAVLRYTQQRPHLDGGAFRGEFTPVDTESAERAGAAPLLQPTDEVLARCDALRAALEREKTERETNIQTYYDELCELWMRFDVPEAEMDAFVLEHRGSTLEVVHAVRRPLTQYKEELDKMRALKSQHMSLFIAKTREQIWEQWDALFMSESERHTLFPAFFLDLPASDADHGFDWDQILAQHEQMCTRLAEMLEQRAPLLALIGRYHEICNEARALEESAQDGSRLLGRSNRGDPGRLLREEKMRKRVKIQKPKVEQELLKVIPAWEAEHNMPFLMDGQRFVDYLQEQLGEAKENSKQPPRARAETGAKAAPAAAPKRPAARPLSRAAAPPRPASRAAAPRPAARTAAGGARTRVAETPRGAAGTPRVPGGPRAAAPASAVRSGYASPADDAHTMGDVHHTPSVLLTSSLSHTPSSGLPW